MPAEAVKVVVRCRPLNDTEKKDGRARIVEMDAASGVVSVKNPKADASEPAKTFTFDQVYDWNTKQMDVFEITAQPIVDSVIEGFNGTIFAYGQTGTGKSFSMEGKYEPAELRGIIPNVFVYVFQVISEQSGSKEFLVRCAYLEIYNEEIRDLLSKNHTERLELKEDPDKGVFVKDLSSYVVKGPEEMDKILQLGKKNRMVGSTNMNADSSRSHSIFSVWVETIEKEDGKIRVGKLNLVDLAGSERQSKTGATGDRLKEGIKINLSLTALGNVISALVDGKSGHIPYRDSKLTRLLQDSLGGNTKTCMCANIGPADWNYDETISTLRYASRAKNIMNKPKINEDPKDAMLREFQDEIVRLKALLAARGGVPLGPGGAPGAPQVVEKVVEVEDDEEIARIQQKLRAEVEAQIKDQVLNSEELVKAREEAEAVARQELEAIAADASKTEEQRRKARDALKKQAVQMDKYAKQLEADKREKEELESKIKAMESKVLHGGVNLLEKVDELKKRSEDTKRELEIRKRQQEEQKRRMAELEMKNIDTSKKYASLEEEIQVKTSQLTSLWEKYKAKKGEALGINEENQRERESLLEDYRLLTQQIKLKNLIIACFIPPDYQDKIMQHCQWNDYESAWHVDYIQYAGNAIRAHQDIAAAKESEKARGKAGLGPGGDTAESLQHVYYSYKQLEDDGAVTQNVTRLSTGSGRPMSSIRSSTASGMRASASRKPATPKKDPTNIGTLRDSVQWGSTQAAGAQEELFPKAQGKVRDAADPRLRKSGAKLK